MYRNDGPGGGLSRLPFTGGLGGVPDEEFLENSSWVNVGLLGGLARCGGDGLSPLPRYELG
jgi:hypothetical protein